jgi:Bacterial mobilisation protein (MobC)
MPRPAKDDPRDRFKTFRFTEAEITRLQARARASGRTLSSYVRRVLLDSQAEAAGSGNPADGLPGNGRGRKTRSRRPGQEYALHRLAEEMRRVGVNLNQIARRMNEQRTPPPRELTMLLDDIRAYVGQARQLWQELRQL